MGVAERTRYERRQTFVHVLERRKTAFLHDVTGVIAIDDVTHVLLLVRPVGVETMSVVLRLHGVGARSIDEILAVQQVGDNCAVNTLVVTKVNTGGQLQRLIQEFVVIGRNQTVPVMVVAVLGNNQFRTVLRSSVDSLYGFVVERTVFATESGGYHTVVRTARQVRIGVLRIRARLGGVAVTATDRYVRSRGQR